MGLDIVVSENSDQVREVVERAAERVDAEVLVSDDLDVYKGVAEAVGLDHQVCRSHVKRNVDDWAESVIEQLKKREPLPKEVDSSPERLQKDVQAIQRMVRERPPNASGSLERMYHRYSHTRPHNHFEKKLQDTISRHATLQCMWKIL